MESGRGVVAAGDFAAAKGKVTELLHREATDRDTLSYVSHPKVFAEFAAFQARHADVSVIPTDVFFHGMEKGEETSVEIEPGRRWW